ncbi:MAG: hypothetical protein L6R48_09100, partial [Planctomycetes bacterium]|nr:hypothetical protein [Planctomycetota bacterium]
EAPLVAALPVGRGWAVVELADLADDPALVARGTLPAWALRSVRRLTAAAAAPRQLTAGTPAPADLQLRRGAREATFKAGEPVMLEPGCWRADADPVLVLPSREEGRTEAPPPPGTATSLESALPGSGGRELALWILLAALALAITEGLVAAWAGRAYGK